MYLVISKQLVWVEGSYTSHWDEQTVHKVFKDKLEIIEFLINRIKSNVEAKYSNVIYDNWETLLEEIDNGYVWEGHGEDSIKFNNKFDEDLWTEGKEFIMSIKAVVADALGADSFKQREVERKARVAEQERIRQIQEKQFKDEMKKKEEAYMANLEKVRQVQREDEIKEYIRLKNIYGDKV